MNRWILQVLSINKNISNYVWFCEVLDDPIAEATISRLHLKILETLGILTECHTFYEFSPPTGFTVITDST